MSRTAPRVPSQTEQPHHPNVKSAANRHRPIDRSSNSVEVTSDHTKNPTLNTAVFIQQSRCRKVSRLWLTLRRASAVLCRYNREITNVLSKRPFLHTSGRHQTRVAASKQVKLQLGLQIGSHPDVRPVLPEQQNGNTRSIANRAAASPHRHMRSTPSPPNRSNIKFR